jgi:hypothetical protein
MGIKCPKCQSDNPDPALLWIASTPWDDDYKKDPRLISVIRKMGLSHLIPKYEEYTRSKPPRLLDEINGVILG